MDCTKCTSKGCRLSQPCADRSIEYREQYHTKEAQDIARAASKLVDNGKAGTLSRLEEIVEYAKIKAYRTLGVAYCYGMEREAVFLREYLETEGFRTVMVSCTVDGISECEVDTTKTDESVSCNPIGQANALNRSDADFTILMGLCLGHDILIQKNLNMDFTTWIVKDRVTNHRPMDALPGYRSKEDLFLETMDHSFHLISWDQLKEKLQSESWQDKMVLIDLRNEKVFSENGIPGSFQCQLIDLPSKYEVLLTEKSKEIILYCNGGMQSLYAVMYLAMKGYRNVKSLAGGFSNYLEKTSHPLLKEEEK